MGSEQSPTSRYRDIETAVYVGLDGTPRIYLRRRFVPPPEQFGLLGEHVVADGDRLDRVAALHLGDPEQFWRLCDGNRAVRPDDLTQVTGRRLRITLPQGIPGFPGG